MTEQQDREFDALVEYLKRTRSFDFSAYKPQSLRRRLEKRMQAIPVATFADYIDYLEVHPEEFGLLFDVILINVTSFFRDDLAWDYLRDEVLPALLTQRPNEPFRVWCAGCASGEETYSVAMLLAEALGREEYRDRVKIYATDVDEQALTHARQATYTDKQVTGVPPAYVEKYFVREGERFVFDKELRRSVIFGRHDLVQDAPISRVNLLVCRNALMYFNSEAQTRILARFHFALADGGVLFLGKAEMLLSQPHAFAPIDLRRRIFRKIARNGSRDRAAPAGRQPPAHDTADASLGELYPVVFDAGAPAQIVVDSDGVLVLANGRARGLFGITAADVGRPIRDLELSYRPVELRGPIEQATAQHRASSLKDVVWEAAGQPKRYFDVLVVPLHRGDGRGLATVVTFADVTRARDLETELARSKQDLETAYEELQSTNEELETTNEELQSTVEELETTNEELQSTNEELETMNEELQSTNEELHATNQDLRDRGDELNRANAFLHSILAGVRHGVIVVDRDLRVIAWNYRAEALWGLRSDEVKGKYLLNLDIGLPIEQVRPGLRACLAGEAEQWETAVSATNRRGKRVDIKVTCTPLKAPENEIGGAIVLLDEQNGTAPTAGAASSARPH